MLSSGQTTAVNARSPTLSDIPHGLFWSMDRWSTTEDREADLDVDRAPAWWFDDAYGPPPPTPRGRLERIKELIQAAPPLIPIRHNRYMVAVPDGEVILSIHQTEFLLWANSFEEFLTIEFDAFLDNVEPKHPLAKYHIPFWDDFITDDAGPVKGRSLTST